MSLPSKPPYLTNVIGHNADVSNIPAVTESGSGALSYASGFPPITGIPLKAGGLAPAREDMNAVTKLLSQHVFFQQSGGVYEWNSEIDYLVGSHVLGSDKKEYVAVKQSGPSTDGHAQNPVGNTGGYWQVVTLGVMKGATEQADGAIGLVPKPGKADKGKYLRGDATWQTPPNTTYGVMGAASASKAGTSGLVPASSAGDQNKFLRADATWGTPVSKTYNVMGAASQDTAGTAGLVPASKAGDQAKFLRADATWVVPTNTTYKTMTGANGSTKGTCGLVPEPQAGANVMYLCGTAKWKAPTGTEVTTSQDYAKTFTDALK